MVNACLYVHCNQAIIVTEVTVLPIHINWGCNLEQDTGIRIAIVDDEQLMREGLRSLFAEQPDVSLVGETDNPGAVLEYVEQWRPDIILINITVMTGNVMNAVSELVAQYPNIGVVAISTFFNKTFVAEAIHAGIRAYLVRQDSFDELLTAVRAVHAGSTYLGRGARQAVVEEYAQGMGVAQKYPETRLQKRERQILRLLADGRSSKEIALALNLSSKTIDASRRRLMQKLEVDSVAGLVKCAMLMGITTLTPQTPEQLRPLRPAFSI